MNGKEVVRNLYPEFICFLLLLVYKMNDMNDKNEKLNKYACEKDIEI